MSKNLTVIGAGVLGSQIAFQAAYHGFNVVSYDINDEALQIARQRFKTLEENFKEDLNCTEEQIKQIYSLLIQSTDLKEAVSSADIIIESIPENLELKQSVWKEIGAYAPKDALLATNTSSILPSLLSEYSQDPQRFLALHFANNIWRRNILEVMGTSQTNREYIEKGVQFGKAIGMKVALIEKEQPGYIINSLLIPLLDAAKKLWSGEIAAPKDIDEVWRISTGSPLGPFEMMDIIGLRTVYAVALRDPHLADCCQLIKENYIDKGFLGKESGQGFYTWKDGKAIK